MPTEIQLARHAAAREALIIRVRKLASQTNGPGMAVQVRGSELAAVLSALDEATAAVQQCEAALSVAPKKGVKVKDDPRLVAAREVIAEADVILSGEASRWGQSLLAALQERCTDDGRDLPAEWRAVVAESVAVSA